jgi:hypothetical protein
MSYFLRETGEYGEMGTYWFAKVLCKSRDLCGNFCKAKSPTYYAVYIYTLTGFSVPSLPDTRSTGAIFSHCSSVSSDISLALSCLLVMAYYPAKGEQNSREVMTPLL